MSDFRLAAVLGACTLMLSSAANAALVTATTPNCGGFNSCDDSSFIALVGGPLDVFLDFETDRFGTPTPSGSGAIAGNTFSNLVTFSSDAGAFGGAPSTDVELGDVGTTFEIGPLGNFTGVLAIDFVDPVSSVGFATVELEANETISVFDQLDNLIGSFNGVSNSIHDYFGVTGTAGEQIGRVELDGDFFAIQNIQFNTATAVPEPESLALIGFGLAAMGFLTRRRTALSRSTT